MNTESLTRLNETLQRELVKRLPPLINCGTMTGVHAEIRKLFRIAYSLTADELARPVPCRETYRWHLNHVSALSAVFAVADEVGRSDANVHLRTYVGRVMDTLAGIIDDSMPPVVLGDDERFLREFVFQLRADLVSAAYERLAEWCPPKVALTQEERSASRRGRVDDFITEMLARGIRVIPADIYHSAGVTSSDYYAWLSATRHLDGSRVANCIDAVLARRTRLLPKGKKE